MFRQREILLTAALASVIALVAPTGLAFAQPAPDSCDTPRLAARTFLDNLQEGQVRPDIAVRCFDWSGVRISQREGLARKLKAVLDQRGLYIDMESIPDVTEPEDDDGRIELARRLPEIFLTRERDQWKISAESVAHIVPLYDDTFSVDIEELVEALPTWMRAPLLPGLSTWQILGILLGCLVGILLRWVVSRFVVGQAARIIAKAGQNVDAKVLRRAGQPIGTLALAGVLWWVLPLLRLSVRVNQIGSIALRVLAATAVVMMAYRLVDLGADIFARRAEKTDTKLDDQLVPLIRKAMKVFVAAVGIIFVLQNLDVDVGSLIAGASLGGLAFTLAAKDTVANLFGSISIFADQPFQVGDWVAIDGKEGMVVEVGMRSTRIRTFNDSVVSIPNSIVANTAVDNFGQRRYRRCKVTLGVTYATTPEQLRAFVEGIRAVLRANDSVQHDGYEVHFRDFGDSALEVFVAFLLDVPSWTDELAERQNLFLEILRLAEALKVEFAYPTQTLHIEREGGSHTAPAVSELEKIVRGFGPDGADSQPSPSAIAGGYWPDGVERE